jgi:hypothetical protein
MLNNLINSFTDPKGIKFGVIPNSVRLVCWDKEIFLRSEKPTWEGSGDGNNKKKNSQYSALCRYCKLSFSGRKDYLEGHVSMCEKIPAGEKHRFSNLIAKDLSTDFLNVRSFWLFLFVNLLIYSLQDSLLTPAKLSGTKRKSISSSSSLQDQKTKNLLLVKAAVYKNIPLKSIGKSNPYFANFCSYLNYDPPGEKKLRSLLSELSNSYQKHIRDTLNQYDDWTLSLDGTTDVSKNSVYGFNITRENEKFFLKIEDLSMHSHKTNFMVGKCKDILTLFGIDLSNIIAVVTDSAANMVSMKNQLRLDSNNRIIPIRCILHWFNRTIQDIIELFQGKWPVLKDNARLLKFLNSSHKWQWASKEIKKENNLSHGLSSFCKTRWYSAAAVCLGVDEYFPYLQDLLSSGNYHGEAMPKPKSKNVIHTLRNTNHAIRNRLLCRMICPVANAIGNLESGLAYHHHHHHHH